MLRHGHSRVGTITSGRNVFAASTIASPSATTPTSSKSAESMLLNPRRRPGDRRRSGRAVASPDSPRGNHPPRSCAPRHRSVGDRPSGSMRPRAANPAESDVPARPAFDLQAAAEQADALGVLAMPKLARSARTRMFEARAIVANGQRDPAVLPFSERTPRRSSRVRGARTLRSASCHAKQAKRQVQGSFLGTSRQSKFTLIGLMRDPIALDLSVRPGDQVLDHGRMQGDTTASNVLAKFDQAFAYRMGRVAFPWSMCGPRAPLLRSGTARQTSYHVVVQLRASLRRSSSCAVTKRPASASASRSATVTAGTLQQQRRNQRGCRTSAVVVGNQRRCGVLPRSTEA